MGLIISDFKRRKLNKFKILYSIFLNRGVSAVLIYRISFWCYKHKMKFLASLLYQLNVLINSCEISYSAEIGKGFAIVHPVGVVIASIKAGDNLTVFQNVTIGKNGKVNSKGLSRPEIKNNVTIYSGAVIAGPLVIGENVIIGANTVVQKDLPDGSKVIGQRPSIQYSPVNPVSNVE
ncbi:serine O-acetyltransferase [Metabacillus schmidteae]|uniref:serine O-acetyltransferase n=1 Tax=Metabacillus schmidteae TaxID=2730405 RepID=UPI00158A33EF|nr:serine O-acetyltransferase [Metabacillus schmidteae]